MENLYDALLSLQRIPNAYENWRDYRASLTAYITRQAPPGATAVLVGAGECNDLDLRRLAAHFSQLTLLDLNTDAMREGLKRQDADSAKIRLVEADLLGVTPDIYRETADTLLEALKTSLRVGGARPDAFASCFSALRCRRYCAPRSKLSKPSFSIIRKTALSYCGRAQSYNSACLRRPAP